MCVEEVHSDLDGSVPGISAIPHDDNARYFDVMVEGPGGSCYEGT